MFLPLFAFTTSVLLLYAADVLAAHATFSPFDYHTTAAACLAVDRVLNRTIDITISYIDVNPSAKTTILMVHGWPSLWSSWSQQIQHLENDYHLIIIDIRGFGGSSHPADVQSSSTMADITGDLTCVLAHAGVSSAICLGHDWGSSTCYEAARRRPDVFSAVIGVTVPYRPPSSEFEAIESIAALIPTLSYQIFFARNTSKAISELNQDVKRTLRGTLRNVESPPPIPFLRSRDTFMGAWDGIEIPPIPFFSHEEEDYFIDRFDRQGFNHSLFFYASSNRYGSWKSAHDQGNFTIPQPVLSVLPLRDPVADWVTIAKVSKATEYLPQLTLKTMDGAHWPHMEFPDVFNAIMDEWLESVTFKGEINGQIQGKHVVIDEL